MQDFLFAALLFVCYFVFACYFFSPGKPQQAEQMASILPEKAMASPTSEMLVRQASLGDAWSSELPSTMAEALSSKFDPEPEWEISTPETQVQEPQPDISARALDVIDKLGKREARRLCSPLGIQQKCNGVELTTELMVASIRREFKTNPEHVIEVICKRLPELLSAPRRVDQKQAS
ncbi:MAG: hypothetical protein KME25_30700 [Symplocastrum torsivum CPER-KK1]|jgi:hypothetical protein|uniref:Uncharacterized protein n=1 Tax=Symplocastrum torsivum CPER-KK1 TaxID=450513 RepID=A0A951UDA5_9CYAN|nr:hypothetical protein [Symplocastrum torsivum CPER-KK1]